MHDNETKIGFDSLGLNELLLAKIHAIGYSIPTPIQAEAIPEILKNKDLLGQAQTGTGKTAAFALPIINSLVNKPQNISRIRVLVLTPTRELALQVSEVFNSFSIENIKTTPIYGGDSYTRQISSLKRGHNIVIGTAGRIMDHMHRGTLDLSQLETLVLDEADEMLRMGFLDNVKWILSNTPDSCQRMLFSATMPQDILSITEKYLRNPVKICIKSKTRTASTVKQRYFIARGISKIVALDRILSCEELDGVIIFVRTKTATIELTTDLKNLGYNVASISGDMSQGQREMMIDQLKTGEIKILVATDVVARGLDVDCISHVINYELPQDNEAYVHRIGRTGRAGREGNAISIISTRDIKNLKQLERSIKQPIEEMQLPNANDISKIRIKNFKEKIYKVINSEKLENFINLAHEIKTENQEVSEENLTGALIFLLQKEKQLYPSEISLPKIENSDTQIRGYRFSENKKFDRPRENRFNSKPFNKRNDMQLYNISIGSDHNIETRNIVGALANEVGIEASCIGQIKIFKNYSTVNLPKNLSSDLIQKVKSTKIRGVKFQMTEA